MATGGGTLCPRALAEALRRAAAEGRVVISSDEEGYSDIAMLHEGRKRELDCPDLVGWEGRKRCRVDSNSLLEQWLGV